MWWKAKSKLNSKFQNILTKMDYQKKNVVIKIKKRKNEKKNCVPIYVTMQFSACRPVIKQIKCTNTL